MRTKALLLTAALGAAGIATSMAQAVYSVNAVGYITLDVPAGFSMIANQLNNGDNKLNTIIPSADPGTTIYKFNPSSGFDAATFLTEWLPNLELKPGEGAFINALSAAKIILVGEVPQGTLTTALPAGFSIASSQVPQEGDLVSVLKFPADAGDTVYFFRGGAYQPSTFLNEFLPPAVPKVGESFFVNKLAAGMWTRSFSVNNP